ncbi:hypothetical protein LOCC1_G005521 [Lachnellula occidentalis]|uniref:BTB domain-containing protein n=1 Tax=Lachnellula occidentalis TaxID=215460 RepID=A0A8H8RK46_9HELO|nr:hypothetical protein LOCC1_G005521 [Lachnellula occidentalis]
MAPMRAFIPKRFSSRKGAAATPKTINKEPGFWKPQELVTLKVHATSEAFAVHKEFACHHSPVFNAAFNGPFIEGQTQVYKLEDTTPRAARLLVYWLYTQNVDLTLPSYDESALKAQGNALAELWVLADFLLIPRLQNAVLSAIVSVRRSHHSLYMGSWEYVCAHTAPDSAIRRLLAHQVAFYLDADVFEAKKGEMGKELLGDIGLALMRERDVFERWVGRGKDGDGLVESGEGKRPGEMFRVCVEDFMGVEDEDEM